MEFEEAIARARAWNAAPNMRPEPTTAKVVVRALVQRLDDQDATMAALRARVLEQEDQLARAMDAQ